MRRTGKEPPKWGRWFRHVEAEPHRGVTVMSGARRPAAAGARPRRRGPRRAAALRPDVAVDARLRGRRAAGRAAAPRRLLADEGARPRGERSARHRRRQSPRRHAAIARARRPAGAASPDPTGRCRTLDAGAAERRPQHRGSLPVAESGLYRVTDGTRTALAAAGALNPIELADVRTTDEKLTPAAQATGGGIFWIGPGALPDLRRVAPDRSSAGRNWIGFRANGDYVVTGVKRSAAAARRSSPCCSPSAPSSPPGGARAAEAPSAAVHVSSPLAGEEGARRAATGR